MGLAEDDLLAEDFIENYTIQFDSPGWCAQFCFYI